MVEKYHISDSGMPAVCHAATADSCPKTQAGDSFHGTREEANAESERRFSEELGSFSTVSLRAEGKPNSNPVPTGNEARRPAELTSEPAELAL